MLGLWLAEGDRLEDMLELGEREALGEILADGLIEALILELGDKDKLTELDGEILGLGDTLLEGLLEALGLIDDDGLRLADGD